MITCTTMTDNELIQGYRDGENSCFDVLLERYQEKVYGYIFSAVKDKNVAEDIFQETFCKAVYTIKNGLYKEENKFIHWVMRIAHNLIVDYFRQINKMPMVPNTPENSIIDSIRMKDDNAERALIRKQSYASVRKLIKMLPPEQRRVVILRHYGKCDFKEIAAKTNVSINTALGRMRDAIINLRRLADEHHVKIDL